MEHRYPLTNPLKKPPAAESSCTARLAGCCSVSLTLTHPPHRSDSIATISTRNENHHLSFFVLPLSILSFFGPRKRKLHRSPPVAYETHETHDTVLFPRGVLSGRVVPRINQTPDGACFVIAYRAILNILTPWQPCYTAGSTALGVVSR